MRATRVMLLALLAMFCAASGWLGQAVDPSAAFAQAGVRVEEIRFEGNERYSSETVKQALRTKEGAPLDRALLNQDIEELYRFFDTVDLVETTTAEGVRLLFRVSENPQITQLGFRGNDRFTETELSREIQSGRGLPLKKAEVENDRATILRKYRREGFHFVEVDVETLDFGSGKAVTFVIYEGPEVGIDDIRFEGAAAFTKAKLLESMVLSETGFLGLGGSDYIESELEKDLLSLRNFYRAEGYLDARVELIDTQFSEDREDVVIVIGVTEGAAYKVGNISIVGGENYPLGVDALRELLTIETGMRRRQEDISRSIDNLEAAYRDEGYASVQVAADEKLPTEGLGVDVTFRIQEQAKVFVRNIDIEGNVITRQDVILREVSLRPGDVLNANEIRKSVTRLRALDYFRRVGARIRELPPGEDPSKKDLIFEVDDTATTGRVRFAIGFSTDLGASATISLTKRNFDWKDWPDRFGDVFAGRAFAGGGQTFHLELSPGANVSSYRVAYTQPWLFDKPISFGWDAFLRQFSRFDYDVDRRGVHLTLGRRWTYQGKEADSVLSLSGTTRFEGVDVGDVESDSASTSFLAEGDNSLISQRATVSLDNRDHPGRPTSGWIASLSTELGVGGDIRFWRNELQLARHFRVHTDGEERPHVFTLRGKFGVVEALGSSEKADPNHFDEKFVPIYERYFAGGGNDSSSTAAVRGFEYGGAGPHGEGNPFLDKRLARQARTVLSVLDNDGDPLGGDYLLGTSAEYSFPLFQQMLRGVFFVDAGMVRDDLDSSHGLDEDTVLGLKRRLATKGANQGKPRLRRLARQIDFDDGRSFFSDVRVSVGFGLRVSIPAFGPTPIALDFGFPIRRLSGDDRQILSFSIARDF